MEFITAAGYTPCGDLLLQKIFKKLLTSVPPAGIITHVVRHKAYIWGFSSAGSPSSALTHPHD